MHIIHGPPGVEPTGYYRIGGDTYLPVIGPAPTGQQATVVKIILGWVYVPAEELKRLIH